MDVFRQELNAFPLRAILDQAEEEVGERGLDEVLARHSVTRADLADYSVWVSVEFVDALMTEFIARLDDPSFMQRAALRGMSQRYMGPLFPLLIGFGSPLFAYRSMPKGGARLDKTGWWKVENLGPGHMRLTWTPNIGTITKPFLCAFKRAQFSYVPVLFSQPSARVRHEHCIFNGHAECIYDVTWQDAPASRKPRVGFLVGGGLGAAFGFGLAAPAWLTAALIASLGLGGWAVGRVVVQRKELQTRAQDIDEHNRALERVTQRNEQRFAELLEAKAEVEQKVEERTAALSLATKQLSQTLAQVQELDRAKTDFFSNVSHDLRTPLTLILGPLGEMASGREPPGGLPHAVDVMKRNGERLLNLINQLLDLAKIDEGRMQIARVPTDIGELARSVEQRFSAAAVQKGINLGVQAGPVAALSADAAWLENALTNLVANALRFARTKVVLRVQEDAGAVLLEVEDDGVGIAQADLPKVFDRFAQGSDVQARKGGTGLGLAIVREAARLHGGEATVSSEPGVATIFRLTLPRTEGEARARRVTPDFVPSLRDPNELPRPAVSATDVAQASGLSTSSAFPASSTPPDKLIWDGPSQTAPLVVVVEDDDDLRSFTSSVLATTYRVHAARDGEEGFELIKRVRPEAVVSDVVMPRMDGYELTKRLRVDNQTKSLPVVLLTARRDVGRVLEGFDAGADDYVTKPFHARELLARVGVHVGLRRMVSEMAHRERLASLGVLAASLAHQIRNPLNAILAGLPAVNKKLNAAMGPRDKEIFGAMIYSGERINQLVADLMDLSRVDSEAVARYRPSDGVQACLRLIEAREGAQVQIDAEIDDSIVLEGRPGDMNHVFLNLIDNAVRAADPGGRVRVCAQRRNGTFAFEVGDSGPGITAEKAEQVFAPFFTTRAAGEGTGLGLAIARQVVLQHGGTISVGRSELGGALFTVAIPAPVTLAPPS